MGKLALYHHSLSPPPVIDQEFSDNQRTLQIELYSFKSNGSHKKIGYFQTVGDDLKLAGRRFTFTGGKKEYLTIKSSKVSTKYTFMDYITGGMEMNFVVGIDFTVRDSQTLLMDHIRIMRSVP